MADSGKQPPRGRGRGRGKRGRPEQQHQQPPQQPRRPGEGNGQQMPQMPIPSDVHPTQQPQRRTHRGAPREDPPPEQPSVARSQVESLESSMAAMSMRQPEGGETSRGGRGRSRVLDDNTRPKNCADKRGTSGVPINIVANYFELLSRPKWAIFQYHVDFAPLVESSRLRHIFIKDHKETLGDCFLFDGMSDLKTLKKVDNGLELFSIRNTDNERIRITLKFITELAPSHPELQRLFNTQMRRNLRHLRYQLLGRHYFDQSAISEIPQYNLQIWQGVITSIRTQEEKLMMSVDTVHKVVRKETALQIISDIAIRMGTDRGGYREAATRELVGSVVMTNYNNRTYSIEDIDWSLTPANTFESKEGPLTYVQYYKKQYDINVRDMNQPLLLCKSKEKEIRKGASVSKNVYLLPELCCMTGLTESMRTNFTMMKEMASHTRLDPAQRVRNLQTFIRRLGSNETIQKEMGAWDLKFANNLVSFQARILPPENIVQRNQSFPYVQKTGDFSREMRGKPMFISKELKHWVIVCSKKDELKARDFIAHLLKCFVYDDRIQTYLQAFHDNMDESTQMGCFIVPNNKKDRYDAIKKNTCLDNAIPSQVIVARTLNKKQMLMSVATKIGIQLNCKLGGEPWGVEIPFKNKIMVIGYDTYHDSLRKGRSAGAFVCSLNQSLTRWYSKVNFHSAGGWQELSNHVHLNFVEALKKYKQENKCIPDLILYYRDGVGDGQIAYVLDWEVKHCKEVIAKMLPNTTKFGFIVVNKKINTRLFAPVGNSFSNPPPGTLVDHTVTRYDRYDFYLVSQCVRQGTVSPTMYNVIEDTSGLKPEYMQRISYKLTHLYYNWPGTIRVPAPCQYAHKLAFLAGQSLHQVPREELCDTLFYL
ncbi:piwi-like protein Siwi [Caerostris extrusa]|uniref:Piwi-like protein Siwi n=1 Tax=Caerostris extrusa TaxID=172846 RepID=A0AAV4XE95_CAEEX|nr:piwi-like protein Siwi [Caerostris extrusa]